MSLIDDANELKMRAVGVIARKLVSHNGKMENLSKLENVPYMYDSDIYTYELDKLELDNKKRIIAVFKLENGNETMRMCVTIMELSMIIRIADFIKDL